VSKKYPYVEVKWVDASAPALGWSNPRVRVRNAKSGFHVTTVGQLLHEDKKCVVVALSQDITFGQIDQSLSIPRGCIVRVRRLKS
jgi:hypothetical protein